MAETSIAATRQPRALGAARTLAPGLCVSVIVAVLAYALAKATNGPGVLFALVLGVSLSWTMDSPRLAALLVSGVDVSMKALLRVGVALLGARVTFSQMSQLGAHGALITLAGLTLSLGVGVLISRALGLQRDQGLILAGATAICGASAALAVAAALPKTRETDAAAAIAGVTVVGAICMVVYPLVARWLGFDEYATGIFLGATLHEVAQAVGAGFSVSPLAGDTAAAVKLLRVACLGPLVIALAHLGANGEAKGAALPWFVIAFVVLALAASFDLLPDQFVAHASAASQWLLLIAIAALGLKTSPMRLKSIGLRPLAVLVVQTAFLCLFVAGALALAS